jgi:3-oxoacyl-[acyl-carrier protein] reductase
MANGPETRDGNRVAIVTGGSGGIGRVLCERLGADGMNVVVHYAGRAGPADETVEAVEKAGGRAIALQGDVADDQAMAAMFDQTQERFGGVDVVVHAAGIMLLAPLLELDLADLDRMHRTNIRGTFVVAQQAARRVRNGGAIINFTSSVVKLAFPNFAAYAASKGAVEATTLILARELRGRDVTVNAVGPGPTATPLMLEAETKESIENLTHMPPLDRLGTPDDIAEVVSFLAGPGRWVNGQVLYVNGGMA